MNGIVVIQDAKILNVVEKSAVSNGNDIKWYEVVFMKDSDVNTITVNRNIAETLKIDEIYDLFIQITELIKTSRSGDAYRTNKFKIIDASEV